MASISISKNSFNLTLGNMQSQSNNPQRWRTHSEHFRRIQINLTNDPSPNVRDTNEIIESVTSQTVEKFLLAKKILNSIENHRLKKLFSGDMPAHTRYQSEISQKLTPIITPQNLENIFFSEDEDLINLYKK